MCGVAHLDCGIAHLWRGVFIVVWRSSLGCVVDHSGSGEAHLGCGVVHCDVAYSSFSVWRIAHWVQHSS
jgi:hypothetical protein